jgi:hypothetical protein
MKNENKKGDEKMTDDDKRNAFETLNDIKNTIDQKQNCLYNENRVIQTIKI